MDRQLIVAGLSIGVVIGMLTGCSNTNNSQGVVSNNSKNNQAVQQPTNRDVMVYALEELDHRVADHSSPDALVYIAPNFNRAEPIELIIYNHGMMTNLNDVEKTWQLSAAMKNADPNTVLIAPEWAVDPQELSDKAGDFHKPGFFRAMLEEVFTKVPELQNRNLNEIKDIRLTSFSGGLYPLMTELKKNQLEEKVSSITLFDSLYKGYALDEWLKKNIRKLASGEKQYHNFYFHTWPASLQQVARVKQMLKDANIETAYTKFDTADAHTLLDAERIASKGIVFKYSMVGIDEQWIGHNAVPKVYLPEFLKAAGHMGPEGIKLAARQRANVRRIQ